MTRLTAALIVCLALPLVGATAPADALPMPPSYVSVLMAYGKDGMIERYEKAAMGQRGLDRVAIAQTVREAKDGGRLTLPEANKIVNAFKRRAQRNAPDPLDAICKQSPLYPPCKDR